METQDLKERLASELTGTCVSNSAGDQVVLDEFEVAEILKEVWPLIESEMQAALAANFLELKRVTDERIAKAETALAEAQKENADLEKRNNILTEWRKETKHLCG